MILAVDQHYLMDESVSTAAVAALAAGCVAAWVAHHLVCAHVLGPGRGRPGRLAARLAIGAALGFAAILAVTQLAQRAVVLATVWPIWVLALTAAVGAEALIELYSLERKAVTPAKGAIMTGLRVALLLLVLTMLAQPVISSERKKEFKKHAVVLLDDSASMHMQETQLTQAEKVRLAASFGMADRPYDLQAVQRPLAKLRGELTGRNDWLAKLDEATLNIRKAQWAKGYQAMRDTLSTAAESLDEHVDALAKPLDASLKLPPSARRKLTGLKVRLTQARRRVAEAMRVTAEKDASRLSKYHKRLGEALSDAAATIGAVCSQLDTVGAALDEAFYSSLPEAKRRRMDRLTARSRYQLSRDVLTYVRPDSDAKLSLLDRLSQRHVLKAYLFHSKCRPASPAKFKLGSRGSNDQPTTEPAELPPEYQKTDLAAALRLVAKETGGQLLAGVVIFSDFRHNAPGRHPARAAAPFSERRVPVHAVLVGSTTPPRDAAILDVEAPESIYSGDKMLAKAQLKFDGLAGRKVTVKLCHDGHVVDSKELRVPTDRCRRQVELTHEPKTEGTQTYRVEMDEFDGEQFDTNNKFGLTVNVADDRTHLLIVEDRPRWEFRYLKNLFTGRDKSVMLQYILFHPDRIALAGAGPLPVVHASAARGEGNYQATALPKDAEEWGKFDVVILGDVRPEMLGRDGLAAIEKFVMERGGTLVVIAGPNYMPGAYSQTRLKLLLPVAFSPPRAGDLQPPEGTAGFRIGLTAEGRGSVITHQDSERNDQVWRSFPPIYWRRRIESVKAGATVLAYARPTAGVPEYVRPLPPGENLSDKAMEARQDKARAFQRQNALIITHNVAAGKVLFLAFDRTWRMRYRVGDKHHHKLWGQIIRWATTDKLAGGSDLVRIGTDQTRYGPDQKVRVRAKLLQPDLTPIITSEAVANLYSNGRLVASTKLQYVANSHGMYTAEVGRQPGGSYRVELEAPGAEELLRRAGLDKAETRFSVDSAAPIEQTELAANRPVALELANMTGGQVLDLEQAGGLLDLLGAEELPETEIRQTAIWSWWPLLVIMILLATCEWILRKRSSLA